VIFEGLFCFRLKYIDYVIVESGSKFKRIALLIGSLTRKGLMARASALEPVEARVCTCD